MSLEQTTEQQELTVEDFPINTPPVSYPRGTVNIVPFKKKTIKFEWNNKTAQSYQRHGLKVPWYLDYQERHFFAVADADQPWERTVTKIARIKAPDHSTPRKELKEYLFWWENWFGKDSQGRRVAPVTDHIEGVYMEQDMDPVIVMNQKVGERRYGEHAVYYVPFSKANVDKIIHGSTGTYKENIKFMVKSPTRRNDEFSYDQFVNLKFDECVELMELTGGPTRRPFDKTKQQYS